MSLLRVAAAAIGTTPRDDAEALDLAGRALDAAAAAGARLLLLPQRLLGGAACGILSDAPPLRALGEAAGRRGVALACGYLEHCSGRRHDAALFIDGQGGALANYRRTHAEPAGDAAAEVAPGHWLNLVRFAGGKVGLLVGADIEAPEPARALALAGASLLAVAARGFGPDGAMAEAVLRTRAFENGCGLLFANLDGPAGAPAALIVGPDGAVLASAATGIAVADLPMERPEAGHRRLATRRPPLYHRLVLPHATEEAPRT